MKNFHYLLLLFLFIFQTASAQRVVDITTSDGLSSSLVNCLYQDHRGDIWIGTENGLNRYDGLKVESFRSNPGDPCSLAHNIVRSIIEDNDGHLIVGGQNGVQIFDRYAGRFTPPLALKDGTPFSNNVNSMLLRRNGEVWLYGSCLLKVVQTGSSFCLERVEWQAPSSALTGEMLEDDNGDIWMCGGGPKVFRLREDGTVEEFRTDIARGWNKKIVKGYGGQVYMADSKGRVCHFDPSAGSFVKDEIPQLEGSRINALHFSAESRLYISTDDQGAFFLDKEGNLFPVTESGLPYDPSKQKIHTLISDSDGNIWLGVFQKGVLMIPAEVNAFRYLGSRYSGLNLIGSCCVTSLMVDDKQTIWVGTDNDGIYVMNREHRFLKHFSKETGIPGTVFDLMQDSRGTVWFGTYIHGFWTIDPYTGAIRSCDDMGCADSDTDSVYAIEEDSRGRIWIGTMGDGIYCYDRKASGAVHFDIPSSELSSWIDDLLILDDNTMYASSYYGLYILDISGETPVVKARLLPDTVLFTLAADDGHLYCGTSEGLVLVDHKTLEITRYTSSDGLGDNMIMSIKVISPGKAWISTSSCLTYFDSDEGSFTNYFPNDGLHVSEFSQNSSTAYKDGMLMFGGAEGVVYFDPSELKDISKPLHVKILDVKASDRLVAPEEDGGFVLGSGERSCSISFTVAEYSAPSDIFFKYSTNGRVWNTMSRGQHSVTLSNLKPGRYSLSVVAVDKENVSDPVTVSFRVRHPWWSTFWAWLVYCLLLALLSYWTIMQYKRHRRDELELENHRRLEAVNEEKVKFFINLSHELRSPMTLIETPLQDLIGSDSDPGRSYKYSVMNKSVRQMRLIIDQILDFRKIEQGRMKFTFTPVGIVGYLACIVNLFKEQAVNKGLTLEYIHDVPDDTRVYLDSNYFDKVVINLISNALKFTPEGGKISVVLSFFEGSVKIDVFDTGVGINDDEKEKIFDRFYQSGNAVSGTGIGLNLAKLITEHHHGTICADHNPGGQGSVFTVTLPLGDAHLSDDEKAAPAESVGVYDSNIPELSVHDPLQADGHSKYTVLIVEDNEDICDYLKVELSSKFNVIVCQDGKQAYNLLLTKSPDVIVSDVMMPGMDGFSLCRKIKKNPNSSHLPVVLLTAKIQDSDKVEGLAAGADAYITKPFNVEVLRGTINNLIAGRESLKIHFSEAKVKSSDIRDVDIKTPDDRLLERLAKVISDNLSNPSLTADDVAQEVGISRVHLYRKLKELTDQTPRDFIKNVRLRKAAEMLSEKKYAISELAEAVGYSSPSSFATAFKELYGQTPSEYMGSSN